MSEHIEYHRFPRGESCTYEGCPAKRYYIADGKRFCKRGHEQEGFQQVQQDEDDFNSQGRITRKKREEKERVYRVFSGREAVQLFLQCYQLVLWKQVKWLIDVKQLPNELETVVRDLWSVRLRSVKVLEDENRGLGSSGEGGFSSQSDWETTETDTDGMESGGGMNKRNRKTARHQGMPKLIDSLALCYLGTLLMRLPITLGDFQRWAEQEELIFVRAIREIPREMRDRLPAQYFAAMELRSVLKRGDLHRAVLGLVVFFKQSFGLVFPPLNAPLIFFKYVKDLCLPLDIYAAARKLGRILGLDFSFPDAIARQRITAYPEIQIICLIIIATKLCQPFDDILQVPESITDPSGLRLNWDVWLEIMSEKPVKELRKSQKITMTDEDVFKMRGKELDDYLDWYQRTWLDDRDPKMPQQILDLFQLGEPVSKEIKGDEEIDLTSRRLRRMGESLIWQKPVPITGGEEEAEIRRAGNSYRYYRTVESLPETARVFYDKAAEITGLSIAMLTRGIYLTERQLQAWVAEEKRKTLSDHYSLEDETNSED